MRNFRQYIHYGFGQNISDGGASYVIYTAILGKKRTDKVFLVLVLLFIYGVLSLTTRNVHRKIDASLNLRLKKKAAV